MIIETEEQNRVEIRGVTDPYTQRAFSIANVLRRIGWNVAYTLFFRHTPRPLHAWRAFILSCFGAKMGRNARVYGTVKIWAPWNLELGDDATIGEDTNCYSMAKIILKEKAIVSQGSNLCTGTHDYSSASFQLYALPIVIGERAWVCTESFIGPGVEIGNGAVIGARSVVTRDMPEWMVCAGNPCKPLKARVISDHIGADTVSV